MRNWGHSGKVQTRSLGARGRAWWEEFPALDVEAQATREFLAIINDYYGSGDTFTIAHRDYRTPKGTGAGTPLVDGGSQTGSSLVTDGWDPSEYVLRAGDIFLVAGVSDAKDVLSDVLSDSAGSATIEFGPSILSGGSPADDAALTVTAIKMTCVLTEVVVPAAGPTIAAVGLRLGFREAL